MAYFADYSRVSSAVNAQPGYVKKLSGLSNTFSGNMNRLNAIAFDNIEKYGTVSESDLVDQAVTDNTIAYQKAYDTNLRNMERMGINPNSGRFQGMNQEYALARAAAEAGARNQARLSAREQNYQRGIQIGSLGAQYGNMAVGAASSAANAYNSYIDSRASLADSKELAEYRRRNGNNVSYQGTYIDNYGRNNTLSGQLITQTNNSGSGNVSMVPRNMDYATLAGMGYVSIPRK